MVTTEPISSPVWWMDWWSAANFSHTQNPISSLLSIGRMGSSNECPYGAKFLAFEKIIVLLHIAEMEHYSGAGHFSAYPTKARAAGESLHTNPMRRAESGGVIICKYRIHRIIKHHLLFFGTRRPYYYYVRTAC
jgi:hypothetical protein